ncbi:MAG TPA: DUF167 domain-containing protein [Planctomycetota bacterium]|nr:DUF167 domain-containing protein [Planctomycetota bacterium]
MSRKNDKSPSPPSDPSASTQPTPQSHLPCTATPGGLEFDILATPGSSKACVRGVHGTALKVALRSPPEKGRANEELVELLADWLDLPPRQVVLIRGATSRQKRVRVAGLSAAALQARIQA